MKAYSLSIFLLDLNQETTWMFSYTKEIVSYINDIKEIPEGTFRINLTEENDRSEELSFSSV